MKNEKQNNNKTHRTIVYNNNNKTTNIYKFKKKKTLSTLYSVTSIDFADKMKKAFIETGLYRTVTESYGERSFSYIAPTLWNALPNEIRFSRDCSNTLEDTSKRN